MACATVGVVICNYNKEQDVLACIQSVLENRYTDYHLYVVDNASTDRSVELIKDSFKNVSPDRLTLLVNSENLGGSGGFNTGLRACLAAGHPYLMCVDNDALLDENCIKALKDFLQEHDNVGIAAAKIYHTSMPDIVQQFGSYIDWDNYCVDSTYLNHPEDNSMPEVVYSDAVPACALMIKRSVVDRIGIMPEENFLYWDDTEWCIRCKEAGFAVASVASAQALHAMGARKEVTNTFPTYYAWRNQLVFFLNHLKESQLEDFAECFLSSAFDVIYSGLYRKEPNKSKTVMAALDDALHGIMGKAGPDRIFDLEFSYSALKNLMQNRERINLITGDYPLYAESLKERLEQMQAGISVSFNDKSPAPGTVTLTLCESIFRNDDLSLSTVYMDLEGNLLVSEDDVLMVINYPYAKRSFLFAQTPLFLRLARQLRRESACDTQQ